MMVRPLENYPDKPITDLTVSEEFPNCVTVEYTPSQEKLEYSTLNDEEKERASSVKLRLLLINGQDNCVCIYPIKTLPNHHDFLNKKYDQIESITLEGFGFTTPRTADEVLELLEELPSGFIKDYEYGLGLLKDYRFIIYAIEEMPEIKHLVISNNHETNVTGDIYTLSYSEFDAIRKGINRISTAHQAEGRAEKNIFSYNSLLNNLNPSIYPEKLKAYKKDVIYKIVSGTSCATSCLSNSDTDAVIDLISSKKQSIYKNKRKKIIQLQEGIELLNLEWLVSETESLLSKNASENKWQNLLNENPFILSLVFGYPVIKIHGQASVGGRKLTGSGDKITDFLIKNNLTNNAALVEIKKPSTPLLKTNGYREGVYAPSQELAGSIGQLLDQKYKFQKEISTIKDNSGVYDIESYSVDCVLIIGTIPAEKEKKKSFELFRYNSRDVRIFTFDELSNKLKDIYLALKPAGN
jgi:hypothetical protein